MKIIELCEEIMKLCRIGDEPEWEELFQYFADEIKAGNVTSIKREILKIYAGMGSFNDLILQKDGVYLPINERLADLRQMLYEGIAREWQ